MIKYQNVVFQQKYSMEILEKFFKSFPEEKRGRKKFKEKEIKNVKLLLYEKIFLKGKKINATSIGLIKEHVEDKLISITVSYFKND